MRFDSFDRESCDHLGSLIYMDFDGGIVDAQVMKAHSEVGPATNDNEVFFCPL